MKRQWDKALYDRYEVVTSPSQLVSWLDCQRKWWFKSVLRLPEVKDQSKFIFGNALHDIVQRWYLADATGRLADGSQVELYPKGWDKGLSKAESALIRKLFDLAVKDGTLRRVPELQVEKEYVREIIPGEVAEIGALDLTSPSGIEDQKSTKAAKWIASQKDLASDPKMLCYAVEWADLYPEADAVPLRLNYFLKDPENPATKVVEVRVPVESVKQFYDRVMVPAAAGMLKMKRAKIAEKDWRKTPGPTAKDACKKYGGCAYASICGGCDSPAGYRKKVDTQNEKLAPMAIFNKKTPTVAGTPPAVPTTPPPTPPSETAPKNAPWAVAGCGACKGRGINSKGDPCNACFHIKKRKGEPTVNDFDVWHDEAGNLCWKVKDGQVLVTKTEPAAPAQPEGKAAIVQEPKTKKAKPPAVIAPVIEEPKAPPEPEQAAGFRLFINCYPMGEDCIDLALVLASEGADLATANEVSNYFEMDAFKRRDALAAHAEEIAASLDGKNVVVASPSPDVTSLANALRPFAIQVVMGHG